MLQEPLPGVLLNTNRYTHIHTHTLWVSVTSPVSLQQFVAKLTQQLEQHLNNKNNFCSCHPFPHSGYREVRVWGGRRWGVRWAEDRLWKHKAENVVDTSQPTWFLGVLGWLSGPHLMWFVKRSHPAWFPCLSKCNKLPSPELAGLVAPSEVNSVPHTGSLKLLGLKLPFLFFLSLFF